MIREFQSKLVTIVGRCDKPQWQDPIVAALYSNVQCDNRKTYYIHVCMISCKNNQSAYIKHY